MLVYVESVGNVITVPVAIGEEALEVLEESARVGIMIMLLPGETTFEDDAVDAEPLGKVMVDPTRGGPGKELSESLVVLGGRPLAILDDGVLVILGEGEAPPGPGGPLGYTSHVATQTTCRRRLLGLGRLKKILWVCDSRSRSPQQ